MKKSLLTVFLGALLVLGACGGDNGNDIDNNSENSPDNNNEEAVDSTAGEAVYKENCATCHGDDLSGDVGPSLEKAGADHSADDIKQIIENGQGKMPPGVVDGQEKDDVAEWLATLK